MKGLKTMRRLEILQESGRLLEAAARRTDCVNGRYLMVHNVLTHAFSDLPQDTRREDVTEYLSDQLARLVLSE